MAVERTAMLFQAENWQLPAFIPDRSLPTIKPLLTYIADDYWKPVIEPASPKEIAMCDERMKDYEKTHQVSYHSRDGLPDNHGSEYLGKQGQVIP